MKEEIEKLVNKTMLSKNRKAELIESLLVLYNVSGSAEADYWSNRCKLVEDIWENTPSGDYIEELAELEQEYHKFIKENGSKHYR